MMTIKRTAVYLFLAAALIVHVGMLLNLAAHFKMTLVPPGWSPVRSGAQRPAHWAKGAGFEWLRDFEMPYFEGRYRAMKNRETSSKALLKIPDRRTSNSGLDFFLRDANNTDPGGDFFQLYQSGEDARRGITIYESNPAYLEKNGAVPKLSSTAPFHPPNRYPPPFAFTIGYVLTLFEPWNALLVWTILHEIALVYCLYLSFRIAGDNMDRAIVTAGMWLGFLPWYLELYMGQTTFILMTGTMVLSAWILDMQPRLFAHIAWLLTLITKPISLLFAPVLLRLGETRVLFPGLILSVLGSAAYFYYHPADMMLFVRWAFGQEMVTSPGNYGFQNFLYRFFFSDWLVRILSVAMILWGLLLTFRWGRFHPVRSICLWIAIYFLGYAHVWQHHQVLLNAAVCLAFLMTGRLRYLLIWLIMTLPSPFYFFEGSWNWTRETLYLLTGTLPAILFMLFLLLDQRERSTSREWE